MDKSLLTSNNGLPITEGLFLELLYSDNAIYTLKDDDYEFKGKKYISIKKRYLEEVITPEEGEYYFATKYFLNWKHWQRLCRNKRIREHIDEWREEVEMRRRADAIKNIINSADDGNYAAAKWVAEGNFCKRKAGRPSKDEMEAEIQKEKKLTDEFSADILRLRSKI